jgi:hypothetical protein
MKTIALCCLSAGLLASACDDNLTRVGITIQPPEDLITVYTDTFRMKAVTVKQDSIFAKTSSCMLGEMYDPIYGTIKADFLCQFYCVEGFEFSHTPYNGKIDSIELFIDYAYNSSGGVSAYGDTLAPMQVSVYPINKPVKRNFYTNDNPENYCDMDHPLGVSTYTPYDLSISDSIRSLSSYMPNVRVKLPVELGQKFYDESINHPETFDSQSAFNEFFPGVYVTNTFGSGNLILTQGEYIALRISYNYAVEDSQGQDSLVYYSQWFLSSKEVCQITRFKNGRIDHLLAENPTHTYVKSPAGLCTKLIIPTTEIAQRLDIQDRFINGFTLNLKYLPADEWDFALLPPSHLLILPEDSVTTFFENANVEDNITSFISYSNDVTSSGVTPSPNTTTGGYSYTSRAYTFGNISNLLKTHILRSPDKDLSLLVLPVYRETRTSNSIYYTASISHTLSPSSLKIRTDGDLMQVVVVSSKFENKAEQ